jgi:hypothetical protein
MVSAKGYSSRVAITLIINGERFPVSHAGHSGLRLAKAESDLPCGNATLLVEIDGLKKQKKIVIPDGTPGPTGFIKFF